MTSTTTENATAPVESGWTWKLGAGEGQHWPLYVSPPDTERRGQQDAIRIVLNKKNGGIILSFLDDVADLETRDAVREELDGDSEFSLSHDVYFLDTEACAGLAAWLLAALSIDEKFLGSEGLGRWVPKLSDAALKLHEAHGDRLYAELDKLTGGPDRAKPDTDA